MDEQTVGGRTREMSERVHAAVLRATAAAVVLLVSAGLAYLVSIDRLEGGALLLDAGVVLGYVLNAPWHRQ